MCYLGGLFVKGSTDFTPFGALFEPKIYIYPILLRKGGFSYGASD